MTDKQRNFLQAVRAACGTNGVTHFDYSVEHWGVLWEPWFVYINNARITLDIEHIAYSDFEALTKNNLLLKTLAFDEQDLNYPLEISRSRYQLV